MIHQYDQYTILNMIILKLIYMYVIDLRNIKLIINKKVKIYQNRQCDIIILQIY